MSSSNGFEYSSINRYEDGVENALTPDNPTVNNCIFTDCTAVRPTQNRGMGLFATESIKQGDKIIEYVGEVKRKATWNQDKNKYIAEGIKENYAVQLGASKVGPQDFIVDATKYGNNARYANHSHDPNCQLQDLSINGRRRLVLVAARNIKRNEELTFDYGNNYGNLDGTTFDCLCGCLQEEPMESGEPTEPRESSEPRYSMSIGKESLRDYSFEPLPIFEFDEEQYQHIDEFLEYMASNPDFQRFGGALIRPARPDLVKFDGIKSTLDKIRISKVLRQTFEDQGDCIVAWSVPTKTTAKDNNTTGWKYFSSGSLDGEDSEKQVVQFFRSVRESLVTEDYAPDQKKSISSGHRLLDMDKLAMNSLLRFDTGLKTKAPVAGIHTPYTYLGRKNTGAGLHREDVDMGSLNLSVWAEDGATKTWFIFGVPDYLNVQVRLTDLREACPIKPCCDYFYRCKGTFISLDVFQKWMTAGHDDLGTKLPPVKVFICHQKPGDLMITYPRAWHQVINTGLMANEAVQHIPLCWSSMALGSADYCECAFKEDPINEFPPVKMDIRGIRNKAAEELRAGRIKKLPEDQIRWINEALKRQVSTGMEVSSESDETMTVDLPTNQVRENSGLAPGEYQCFTCDYKTTIHSRLVEHVKIEHKVRCPGCTLIFPNTHCLVVHQGIVHPEKVSKCKLCGAVLKDQVALNRHCKKFCKNRPESMDQ